MPITEVVVDRKVLDSLKRRMLREYPNEYCEYGVGKIKRLLDGDETAYIHYFRDVEIIRQHPEWVEYVDDNEECEPEDRPFQVLAHIHSHPDTTSVPSDTDWEGFNDAEEPLMAVCAIRKRGKRRFVSWSFYNEKHDKVELTIAE